MSRYLPLALAMAMAFPGLAIAHTGHPAPSGFAAGFAHPFGGLDHLLAMLAVGFLAFRAARRSGRSFALWLVPGAFLIAMILGGALGLAGLALPFAEIGIAVTLLLMGIALAADRKGGNVAISFLVGIAGIFHGFAHGAEMPIEASAAAYVLGFVLATAALHFGAILLAHFGARAIATTNLAVGGGSGA